MVEADLLYEHYKETVAKNETSIRSRNRYFVALLVVAGLSAVLTANPLFFQELAASLAETKLGLSPSPLNAGAADILVWLTTLYLLVRYIQLAIGIERNYIYLKSLEHDLEKAIGSHAFCREGDVYADNYPFALNLIDFAYKAVFPCAFLLSCTVHMSMSVRMRLSLPYLAVSTALFGVTVLLLASYLAFLISANRTSKVKCGERK